MAVTTEKVENFVHAVVPSPRGENLDAVFLHGADEGGVGEGSDHRVVFVDKACFGDAERDAVAFAKVLIKPVVDALEDEFFCVIVVPFAGDVLDSVCARVVVGCVEQYTVPVHAGFVILFARVPMYVENIEQSHAGFFLFFGDFHDKVFEPAVIAVGAFRTVFFVVRADRTTLPFVRGDRAGELDVFPQSSGFLGNVDVVLYQKISRDGQVEVGMRAAPDFHFVVHAPVLETVHVELEIVSPVRDNCDGGVGGPFHVIEFVIASLDKRFAIVSDFAATREV